MLLICELRRIFHTVLGGKLFCSGKCAKPAPNGKYGLFYRCHEYVEEELPV